MSFNIHKTYTCIHSIKQLVSVQNIKNYAIKIHITVRVLQQQTILLFFFWFINKLSRK